MNALPLTQRVLIGGESPSFQHGSTCRTSRCLDYKAWSDESMTNAISAVTQEGMSVRRAAETYGIPRSTLGHRISGRIVHGASSGAIRFLTDDKEDELVAFILGCASMGYSKTIKEILVVVQKTLESRGVHKVVSYGWWELFRKRHPNLTLHVATSLSKARVSDDSGKSVCITHTRARARTHTHTHTFTCTCSFLPIIFQTKRILLLVTCEEDKQVVWVVALGQHSQLLYLTSPSRGEPVVAEEGAS